MLAGHLWRGRSTRPAPWCHFSGIDLVLKLCIFNQPRDRTRVQAGVCSFLHSTPSQVQVTGCRGMGFGSLLFCQFFPAIEPLLSGSLPRAFWKDA